MTQISILLNAISNPAFLLKDGKISLCNSSCSRLMLEPGQELPALTEQLPENLQQVQTQLTLAEEVWTAAVRPLDDSLLVTLEPMEKSSQNMEALLSLAQTLKTPLSALFATGASLFPLLEEQEDDVYQAHTSSLTRSFFQVLRAVNTAIDLAVLSRGDLSIHPQKTHIKEFFDALASRWSDMLMDANIQLEYQGPAKAFNGNIDQNLVQKAVLCLLSNAAVFGLPDTPIRLQISYMAGKMKIQVKNQCDAAAAEQLSSAFSHYRKPSPVGDGRCGAGFSLPLVQTIAQLHGGVLMLDSSENCITATMVLRLDQSEETCVQSPRSTPIDSYAPDYTEFSILLPRETYDSRNIDL